MNLKIGDLCRKNRLLQLYLRLLSITGKGKRICFCWLVMVFGTVCRIKKLLILCLHRELNSARGLSRKEKEIREKEGEEAKREVGRSSSSRKKRKNRNLKVTKESSMPRYLEALWKNAVARILKLLKV